MEEVATPLEFVVSVSVVFPLAKVPLGPEEGAVKVTDAPLTGLFLLSSTVRAKAAANAVPTVALCPEPPLCWISAGGPELLEPPDLLLLQPTSIASRLTQKTSRVALHKFTRVGFVARVDT